MTTTLINGSLPPSKVTHELDGLTLGLGAHASLAGRLAVDPRDFLWNTL